MKTIKKLNIKTVFSLLMVVIFGVSGIVTASAASVDNKGEYALILDSPMDAENGCFDGEYSEIIRFNVSVGETKVSLSELTKGITPFNGKTEFSHWETRDEKKVADELEIADFKSSGSLYKTTGEEIKYDKGLTLVAKFEGKDLKESGNYYVTLDAFGGTINSKASMLLQSKATEFKTVDLTEYVPERKGYTFVGWDLDGKLVTTIDANSFDKNAAIVLTATYTKDTFDGDGLVLTLNANGGNLNGKDSDKYDYLGGGNSGTAMSLLPYTPTREGYTFTGWNTKSDGSGKNYTYIYWRVWDKDEETDKEYEKDTLITEESGYERYKKVTLYASWISNSSDKTKELKSTGKINGTIEFAEGINKDYKLDVKEVVIKKELADKNVKFITDINVLEGNNVVKISNTKMKIRIALPENLKGYDKYEVVYILNNKIQEAIPATIEDGYIVFETSHLSQYGIIATNTAVNAETKSPKTGDNGNIALLISTLFASGCVLVISVVKSKKVRRGNNED